MYQIIGGQVSEQAPSQRQTAAAAAPTFSEEDVRLVADQTGKSLEKAKEALEECGGDLAKAILAACNPNFQSWLYLEIIILTSIEGDWEVLQNVDIAVVGHFSIDTIYCPAEQLHL